MNEKLDTCKSELKIKVCVADTDIEAITSEFYYHIW